MTDNSIKSINTVPDGEAGELARAQEARFVEALRLLRCFNGAEYYGESGVSDAQDEAMREREDEEVAG
tara:strand:- start:3323 stop:3526 length:204 start_codon:yes stop_codon:yes gene_type:complete